LEKRRAGELDPERMHPSEVRAYLTQTSIYKALDEGKRAERKRAVPMTEEALAAPDDRRTPEDLAATGLDNARIREVLSELPERRQVIVKLRYFFDRTPAEIQRYLGITERVYRRELERALKQVVDGMELVRSDQFCDSRKSLILAYVAGIAGPTRVQQARAHLASCPGCARWAATVRDASARAAAMIPLPVIARDDAGLTVRAFETLGGVRDQLADTVTSVKQHVFGVASRLDPGAAGYATAARPGAAVMAITGCLAVGGGATYCVVEGIPGPVRNLVSQKGPKPERDKPRIATKRAANTTPTPTPTTATPFVAPPAPPRQTSPPRQQRKATPTRSQPRAQRPIAREAAAAQEFDPAAAPPPARTPPPPPAPPQAPGEFDP
jgi:RNA polymerase sigma factor (sigma-70 family)